MNAITLHPFQRKATAAVLEAWKDHQSTMIVMPTGTGKTITFASILSQRIGSGRGIVLAHRQELIGQAQQKIQRIAGVTADIEMGDMWADQGWSTFHAPIIVSSIQTQISGRGGSGRMTRFKPNEFATAIADECHRATAPSWRKVLDYYRSNKELRLLGVTATPNRHDEQALGQIFESCAFNYGMLDAINDGWLVPVRSFTMPIEDLDISAVSTTAGDLNGAELAREMEKQKPLLGLANAIWRETNGRKTLVFAASVEHARLLCGIFNTDYQPGCARFVSGKTPKDERREIVRAFANREFQFLCNCGVFTEGYDDPGIECVVPKPTKSTPAYIQAVGRATRVLPGVIDSRTWDDEQRELGIEGEEECASLRRRLIADSAKPHCEVLDLFCQTGRHKLVTAADALGGEYSDAVVERAAMLAREDGKSGDPSERLRRAAEQLRQEAEVILQRQAVQAKAKYKKREADPFALFDFSPTRKYGWDTSEGPTPKQLAALRRAGVDPDGLSRGEAGKIINEQKLRWKDRVVSDGQAKVLTRAGFRGDMKAYLAKPILDVLFANRFRWPSNLPRPNPDGTERGA